MDGFTEGRIVHFVLPNGEHRAAMIVRAWPPQQVGGDEGVANMQVMLDGTNDGDLAWQRFNYGEGETVHVHNFNRWETSVHYSEGKEPRTWHWIEKA